MSRALEALDLIRAELEASTRAPARARYLSVVPASADHLRKVDAKRATSERIVKLWPELSWRQRARMLRVHESTLRGQLDCRVMNREPSAKVLALLDAYEQRARLDMVIGGAV